MVRSQSKGSNRDLITGSWVAITDLFVGRNTFGFRASGSGFDNGDDQFLFGIYRYSTKVDKKGRRKAILFDDTDRDGIIDKGETKIGSFKVDINAINDLVQLDASSDYYKAMGYIQLNMNNGKLSIFDEAGGDLLGTGKLTPAGLHNYIVPVSDL